MSYGIFSTITVDDVKALRESEGCGIMEAKKTLQVEAALRTIGDLEEEGAIDARLGELLAWLVRGRQ